MAYLFGGILLALLLALTTLFIWTPLGFFTWFGLNQEVLMFHAGYRLQAVPFLILFYALNFFLIYQAAVAKRRLFWAIAIYSIWGIGFLGFFRVYSSLRAGS